MVKHNCETDLNLEYQNITFSHQNKNSIENYMFVLGKYYIYKNKFSENNLNKPTFISLLRKKFNSGKCTVSIHNKFIKLVKKWTHI